jgi:serine/threonine-protein kinase
MKIRCPRCNEELDVTARFCGACGATITDPNIERTIAGRYVLKERILGGSIGIVYRAEQRGVGRKIAIKLLPSDAATDPLLIARFKREGEVLCRLRSPHTVTTYEFDRDPDGTLYIAMELPSGRSLAEICAREGALEWRRALRILGQVCDSIAEAHTLGIVHRDLRPDSIVVGMSADGREVAKVLDFGLAKLLYADITLSPVGQTTGAIEYLSPEQLRSKPIDSRTDVYGVGILGYLLITGRHPFQQARTYGDLVAAHLNVVPPLASTLRPDLPPGVDFILQKCLEKDPEQRFPSAAMTERLITIALNPTNPENDTLRNEGEEDTALADIPIKRDR